MGFVSLALGIIGVFLPILPTTPFIILAAWCFVRSSERAHAWLYRQPLFGTALKNWDQKKAIARPAKLLAISMILVSIAVMWWRIANPYVTVSLSIVMVAVIVFIATRNEV
jgi:uncharacterized membrane protein YbaN (DUF454 family)